MLDAKVQAAIDKLESDISSQATDSGTLAGLVDADNQAQTKLDAAKNEFESQRTEFMRRVVSFQELCDENAILRTDLRNLSVQVRKLQLDRNQQQDQLQ